MDKNIYSRLVDTWGVSKMAQWVLFTLMGTSIFGFIGALAIPNKPEIIEEKEID